MYRLSSSTMFYSPYLSSIPSFRVHNPPFLVVEPLRRGRGEPSEPLRKKMYRSVLVNINQTKQKNVLSKYKFDRHFFNIFLKSVRRFAAVKKNGIKN